MNDREGVAERTDVHVTPRLGRPHDAEPTRWCNPRPMPDCPDVWRRNPEH